MPSREDYQMRKLFNQSAHEKSKKNEKTGENARTEEQSHGIREALRRAAEVLLIPVCALYMEIISKLRTFGELFQTDIVYMISLAAAMGFLFAAIPLLLPGKHRRRVFTGIMAAMSVLFSFHAIYFNSFHTFYSWNNLGQAGGATHFWREALIAAGGVWYVLIAFFVPTVAFGVFGKKLIPDDSKRTIPLAAVSFVLAWGLYIPSVLVIDSYKNSGDESSPYYQYIYIQNDLDQTFRRFGVINATRLDFKQLVFGAPDEKIDFSDIGDFSDFVSGSDKTVSGSDSSYGWNMMNIDFDGLAYDRDYANMDEYYKSLSPTRKNQYTGIFKGKNLIFLTLESFCSQVIDPEFTPLLYKMSTEGYVFKNFYNPLWGGSTASGEYAIMTGNFHPNTNCIDQSAGTYQPFALGNQFSKLGYKTLAYHNYVGYFYNREASHPNFGYEFKSSDSGLEMKTHSWPSSDKELADATIGEYSHLNTPFHVYYMTMSGHMKYYPQSNKMSQRHMNDLPEKYNGESVEVRAFRACQYEVELMLQVIVDELEKSGKLNDTVFAMAADHYPYGMSDSALSELYGLPNSDIRSDIELYHNSFILWTPSMTEPVTVNTPCSPVDILPTLSNMFGLEYDSRLMMGTDIMAPGEHVAPIKVAGWSWVSAQGSNNKSSKRFIPSAACTRSEEEQKQYVERMNKLVNAKTTFSKLILDRDYYSHVFNKQKNAK